MRFNSTATTTTYNASRDMAYSGEGRQTNVSGRGRLVGVTQKSHTSPAAFFGTTTLSPKQCLRGCARLRACLVLLRTPRRRPLWMRTAAAAITRRSFWPPASPGRSLAGARWPGSQRPPQRRPRNSRRTGSDEALLQHVGRELGQLRPTPPRRAFQRISTPLARQRQRPYCSHTCQRLAAPPCRR